MIFYMNELIELGAKVELMEMVEESKNICLYKYSLLYKGNKCGIYVAANKRRKFSKTLGFFDLDNTPIYRGKATLIESYLESDYLEHSLENKHMVIPAVYTICIVLTFFSLAFSLFVSLIYSLSKIGILLIILQFAILFLLLAKQKQIQKNWG